MIIRQAELRDFDKIVEFYDNIIDVKNQRKAIRLDVLEPNLPAHELYKKHGFQLREVKDLFYEDTGRTKFMLYELVL